MFFNGEYMIHWTIQSIVQEFAWISCSGKNILYNTACCLIHPRYSWKAPWKFFISFLYQHAKTHCPENLGIPCADVANVAISLLVLGDFPSPNKVNIQNIPCQKQSTLLYPVTEIDKANEFPRVFGIFPMLCTHTCINISDWPRSSESS